MPIFEYSGKDNRGLTISGVIDAATEDMAIDLLEERGIVIYSLKKRESSQLLASLNLDVLNRVKLKDVVVFTRQLSVMIAATLMYLPVNTSCTVIVTLDTIHAQVVPLAAGMFGIDQRESNKGPSICIP